MKTWKWPPFYFYFLMMLDILLSLLDIGIRIFYACNQTPWLKWSIKGAYPNALGTILLMGFPYWLGTKCKLYSQRNVFLIGMLFNLGTGLISDIAGTLQWQFFLTRCMPDIYATVGGRQAVVITWLTLPIRAALGGTVALIGYMWSRSNFAKKDRAEKK